MKHFVLIGIEHLMTGLLLRSENGDVITFERESSSIIRATCDSPMDAYWEVNQSWLKSTPETEERERVRYSHGEAEHYAKNVAGVLADIDSRSQIDMQTYTRTPDYTDDNLQRSRFAPREPSPFPWAVVKAMRRKHGAEADKFLAMLRWSHDHWYYTHDRMYIGVEPDGYIHT